MNTIFYLPENVCRVSAQHQANLDLSNVKVEFFKFDVQQKYQEEVAHFQGCQQKHHNKYKIFKK